MPNNISVAITAEVIDLQTKLAIGQSEVRNFNSTVRDLADQMRAASDDGKAEFLPALQAAASGAAQAKAEVAALNAEIKGLSAAGTEAATSLASIGEDLEGVQASITNVTGLFSRLSELFLVGFGIEKLADLVLESAELGEEMVKTSQTTGMSVEALSELRFAAETSGVSFENLQTGLRKLSTAIQEGIQNPSSKAGAAFQQLGISSQTLADNQNDLEAILRKVADAYAAHADGAIKDANATELMGRGGAALIPVLDRGAAGLEAMAAKARELGAVMNDETAERLADIKERATALRLAWDEFAANITATIAPAVTYLIDRVNELFASMNQSQLQRLQAEAVTLAEEIQHVQDARAADKNGPEIVGPLSQQNLDGLIARLKTVQEQITEIQKGAEEPARAAASKPALPGAGGAGPTPSVDIDAEKELTQQLDAEFQQRAAADAAANAVMYANQRELDEETLAEARQQAAAQKAAAQQTARDWDQALRPLQRSFNSAFTGMITGTETFQQAVQKMSQTVLSALLNVAERSLVEWLESEAQQTAATEAGVAARSAAQAAGAAAAGAADTAATKQSVIKHAYSAAAAVYDDVAQIPYAGAVLAPPAAAAAFAAVMAFGADIPSAEGGFDIPSGVNPFTQLHEEEMVLPASLANIVRGAAAGGGGASGGGGGDTYQVTFQVQAIDTQSGANFLKNNAATIATAISSQLRNQNTKLRSALGAS